MPNKKHNHYKFLADKWTKKHKEIQKSVIKKHKKHYEWLSNNSKQLAVGSLAGITLLTSPGAPPPEKLTQVVNADEVKVPSKVFLITDLNNTLPDDVRELNAEEEQKVGDILSKNYGMKVSADLDGFRLNRSYGIIGAEQHLARYPGDTMQSHFDGKAEDQNRYYSSGMAPGLGAWGYFATSKSALTEQDVMREKYYIAAQTFLVPDYNERVGEYRDFFKYRKMLIVNPENGKAVVAVIGDAGPAKWTGKHLGGSPEVMKHLERVDGSRKGPVLYFFIDDPDDTIPLGPVEPK